MSSWGNLRKSLGVFDVEGIIRVRGMMGFIGVERVVFGL